MSSTSRTSHCPSSSTRRRAKRRIGLGVTGLADALILCGLRYGSAAAVAATEEWLGVIEREAYLASTALGGRKGRLPAVRPRPLSRGRDRRGARRRCARGDRAARHPQRAPDLGCADRHDLAVRRQRLVRDRAGLQLSLHPQRADARRHAPRGGGRAITPTASSAGCGARPRRCPIISSTPRC